MVKSNVKEILERLSEDLRNGDGSNGFELLSGYLDNSIVIRVDSVDSELLTYVGQLDSFLKLASSISGYSSDALADVCPSITSSIAVDYDVTGRYFQMSIELRDSGAVDGEDRFAVIVSLHSLVACLDMFISKVMPRGILDTLQTIYGNKISINSVAVLLDKFNSIVNGKLTSIELAMTNDGLLDLARYVNAGVVKEAIAYRDFIFEN